jgi:hypothetical protein
MYLRSFGNPPSKFVNLMHDSLYGGAKHAAPSPSEFHQILQNARDNSAPRGRGNSGATAAAPAPTPSYSAPQQSYQAQQPAAPAPRGPAPAGPRAPAPAPRAAAAQAPEDTTTEWYWIDRNGAQKGPALQAQLKQEWRQSQVDGECIAWNASMGDWAKLATLTITGYLNA